MKLIEIGKCKIAIHPCFFILIAIVVALGCIEQFFILFMVITIHEMAHIIVAKMCGAKLVKIVIYPIGEMAIIGDMFLIKPLKRILIIGVGPIVNIVLGLIFMSISNSEVMKFTALANFSIALFNIIPIYPLDGGRLLHTILCGTIGVLNANQLVLKISKILVFIYIILGLIQVILYPYNISLICIGLYLRTSIKKEEFSLCLNFFENIFSKSSFINKNGGISTHIITVSENVCMSQVLKYLKSNSLCRIYVVDKEQNFIGDITESQLINFIMEYGTHYNIKNAIKI